MSTFWRPWINRPFAAHQAQNTKQLGRGWYKLWARCDLCFESGPYEDFTVYWKDADRADVCGNCGGDEHLVGHLLQDGWRPQA